MVPFSLPKGKQTTNALYNAKAGPDRADPAFTFRVGSVLPDFDPILGLFIHLIARLHIKCLIPGRDVRQRTIAPV